jgi:hypothetical protein
MRDAGTRGYGRSGRFVEVPDRAGQDGRGRFSVWRIPVAPAIVDAMSDEVITRDEVIEVFGALADIKSAVLDILWLLEGDDEEEEDLPDG